MNDTTYFACKGEVWDVVHECKYDQNFIILIVVLCVLSYHIWLRYIENIVMAAVSGGKPIACLVHVL